MQSHPERRGGASDLRYRLSVNVSANDLADRGVVERISQALGARGESLTVEITETALMKDTQSKLAKIQRVSQH